VMADPQNLTSGRRAIPQSQETALPCFARLTQGVLHYILAGKPRPVVKGVP
jgi:hypothetical protein